MLRQHPFQDLITHYIKTGDGLAPELERAMVAQYDGEIAYADHWVGRLIEYLKNEGLYDNTLLIVLSDHGRIPRGASSASTTASGIYEGGLRVPILVKYPDRRRAGEVNNERVSISTSSRPCLTCWN